MKQEFGPLGVIDLLTAQELKETMGHHFDREIRERLRGIDYLGFAGSGNGTSTVAVAGPDSGYCWSVRLISAQLSAAGVLSVYPGDAINVAPVETVTALNNTPNFDAVILFSSNAFVLKDQRNLTLYCGAGQILNWRILVKQVPTEMQGKL